MNAHELPGGIRRDTLSGDYIIYQPQQGQRYTTDDMLVAWLTVRTMRDLQMRPGRFLDLGSGLCSVPMIVLWAFQDLQGLGIEKSLKRLTLGRKSLSANSLDGRFRLILADLRDMPVAAVYPLVTSSPPYYEFHEGPVSPDRDKARVRFELHGSIDDYFRAAHDHLEEGGCFTTVYPCQYEHRAYGAAESKGFTLERRVQVIPRATKPPLISLYAFVKGPGGRGASETLTIRNEDQSFTVEYNEARKEIGFREKEGG